MKRPLRFFLLLFIVCSTPYYMQAQFIKENDEMGESKFYVGGGVGLMFGNETSIYIAPEIAYAFSENFHAGLGVSFEYYSNRAFIPRRNIYVYGGKIFARYFVLENFFAMGEFEHLFYRDNYINPIPDPILTNEGLYVGGGYRQWIGSNSFMMVALLFNVFEEDIIFGINPFFRVGVSIGI